MWAAQLVLVPAAAVALLAGWLFARRRWSRSRLLLVAGIVTVDLWCWLAALDPPIGPHVDLLYVLIIVNVPVALGVIQLTTGFQMRPAVITDGRTQQAPRPDYDGYRGD